ncbi:leukocyte antigen CD37 isoform X2 [Silurus meridionalis]|uniref:leukocyte antigen CD37 isoform X2 n=1 Tax=Silurus meridionalis TaxID=175797 RepID=UPI001EEB7EE7|nr:leukocyte antigen CD37 isoform X2 [Silurus meridionalis]
MHEFLGLSLLGLGIWIICSDFPIPIPSYLPLSHLSYLLVISGSVTFLLGFFGSLGALKEVKCMLAIYFILLTMLLAAQTIGTVLLFTQRSVFETFLGNHVTGIMKQSNSNLLTSLEFFQHEAKCCGWNGKYDWTNIPCSCFYKNATANATDNATDNATNNTQIIPCPCQNSTCGVYEQNCGKIIIDWVNKNLLIVLGVILALALVEICGIILSMCLYKQESMNFSMHK